MLIEFRYTANLTTTGAQQEGLIRVEGTSYTACFLRAAVTAAAELPPDAELLSVEFWARHA